MGKMDMCEVVKLPAGQDINDWLAVHVTDFYNDINALYGTIMSALARASETRSAPALVTTSMGWAIRRRGR